MLAPQCSVQKTIGVRFSEEFREPAMLNIGWGKDVTRDAGRFYIKQLVGEMIRPVDIPITLFEKG